jgi:multidrug efflux pump
LLKAHGTPKDVLSRWIERLFGWMFRPFNRFFKASSDKYQGTVSRALYHRGTVFAVYALLLLATAMIFQAVPRGFIPTQDKLFLMAGVKLPEGASLERTDLVLRRVVEISKSVDGIAHVVAMTGLNPLQFTNTPNYGIAFLILKPFSERHRSAKEISEEMNQKLAGIQEGMTFVLMPPPILGLGSGAGYSLFVEDRVGLGFGALQNAVNALQGAVMQTTGMGFPISGYQSNVPQLDVTVDRVKTKAQGIALTELFNTLQVYLGSAYVNDFNVFGRTWRIYAQADGDFRGKVEDIANLKTRNDRGEMVPIGSLVKLSPTYGPDPVLRYNGYPAADFLGEADPTKLSSAQAMDNIRQIGGDNNTFVQVGLVVLMGLACKNAILIVEFAREVELQGKDTIQAALEACRLRLRPIVMTSVAFIAGTVPLVLSHGAGAEVRSATGITVFAGMIGVTLFGLFLTPVFYVGLRLLSGRKLISRDETMPHGALENAYSRVEATH